MGQFWALGKIPKIGLKYPGRVCLLDFSAQPYPTLYEELDRGPICNNFFAS